MTEVSRRNPIRRAAHASRCAARALLAVAGVLSSVAHGDPVDVVNALRVEGCGGRPGVGARLTPRAALDSVARQLARDDELEEAFDLVGYPPASSTSFHVRGSREDASIKRLLSERFCESVNDARYEEIGYFASGTETWIVLALPQTSETPMQPATVAARVLALVNAARAEGRRCGRDRFEPAHALALSDTLNAAASGHAWDMAARGETGHRGSDGGYAADRITRAGYTWRAVAENVAAGQPDADTVVAAWLDSPGHCANLMGPYFTEMGIAFATAASKRPSIYWVQVFAAPQ
jgi:uncharacterized protein YkwD